MGFKFLISAIVFVLCTNLMAVAQSNPGVSGQGLGVTGGKDIVFLEIIDGDTAFMIDRKANEAWWIVGECRHALPMKAPGNKRASNSQKSKSAASQINSQVNTQVNSQINSMTSEIFSRNVRIGSRQLELRQQFRFNMATRPASIDVFNSVRGGWSSIPVQVNETCDLDPTCRRRMELDQC